MAFLSGFKTYIAVGLGLLTIALHVFTGEASIQDAIKYLSDNAAEIFGLLGIAGLRSGIKTSTGTGA